MNIVAPELVEESVARFRTFLVNATVGDTFLATAALGARLPSKDASGVVFLEVRSQAGYIKTELSTMWSKSPGA